MSICGTENDAQPLPGMGQRTTDAQEVDFWAGQPKTESMYLAIHYSVLWSIEQCEMPLVFTSLASGDNYVAHYSITGTVLLLEEH